jgi:hypothetical protein
MNGPTPIISSMLKATADRSPMRRCSVPELVEGMEDGFMRSDCCSNLILADCKTGGDHEHSRQTSSNSNRVGAGRPDRACQLPELVPGAYRRPASLLSAGSSIAAKQNAGRVRIVPVYAAQQHIESRCEILLKTHEFTFRPSE